MPGVRAAAGTARMTHTLLIAWAAFSAGVGVGFVVCALFMGGNDGQ